MSADALGAPQRLSILILADDDPGHARTVLEHIASFGRYSTHEISYENPVGRRDLASDVNRFDVLVVHWSIAITFDSYLSPDVRRRIRAFRGMKIQFIQDEHRWVNEVTATMTYLGIDLVYSVAGESERPKLYSGLRAEVRQTLTGYVSEELERFTAPRPDARRIDIGYRGRPIPFWMGVRTYEKLAIGQGVLERAAGAGLTCDIAWTEDARIYGDSWLEFLASCKTVLGTPSGASIADFDGTVERTVREYLAGHPHASFEEVAAAVLGPWEGNVDIDVISPRIFEAAALRTALILFPGSYSGILEPWRHYLPLCRDFSNLPVIAEAIKDPERLRAITDTAHAELIASGVYSYRAFVATFDDDVRRSAQQRSRSRPDDRGRRWVRAVPRRLRSR